MNKTFILSELTDLYEKIKINEDFKSAINILKLMAHLQGFFEKTKEFDIKKLSDRDLKTLIERIEEDESYAL
jgi:hypothetical protein